MAAGLMLVLSLTLSRAFFAMIERPFMVRASAMKALERVPGSTESVSELGFSTQD
jgi:hypothetical protein